MWECVIAGKQEKREENREFSWVDVMWRGRRCCGSQLLRFLRFESGEAFQNKMQVKDDKAMSTQNNALLSFSQKKKKNFNFSFRSSSFHPIDLDSWLLDGPTLKESSTFFLQPLATWPSPRKPPTAAKLWREESKKGNFWGKNKILQIFCLFFIIIISEWLRC